MVYQHGLMDSGAGIFCDEERSLAFFLVDSGYDVWIANSRGSRYSKAHRFLDPNMPDYWDFSF